MRGGDSWRAAGSAPAPRAVGWCQVRHLRVSRRGLAAGRVTLCVALLGKGCPALQHGVHGTPTGFCVLGPCLGCWLRVLLTCGICKCGEQCLPRGWGRCTPRVLGVPECPAWSQQRRIGGDDPCVAPAGSVICTAAIRAAWRPGWAIWMQAPSPCSSRARPPYLISSRLMRLLGCL